MDRLRVIWNILKVRTWMLMVGTWKSIPPHLKSQVGESGAYGSHQPWKWRHSVGCEGKGDGPTLSCAIFFCFEPGRSEYFSWLMTVFSRLGGLLRLLLSLFLSSFFFLCFHWLLFSPIQFIWTQASIEKPLFLDLCLMLHNREALWSLSAVLIFLNLCLLS